MGGELVAWCSRRAGIFALLWCSACTPDATLLHDLSEAEAADAVALLQAVGVAAESTREAQDAVGAAKKEPAQLSVRVASDDVDRALALLQRDGWLGQRQRAESSARDAPLLPTLRQETEQREATLASALARQLDTLPCVARVFVRITLPSVPSFASTLAAVPSAALVVRGRPGHARCDEHELLALTRAAIGDDTQTQLEQLPALLPPSAANRVLFTKVGPFFVAQRSARELRIWLALGLCVNIVLALGVMLSLRKARRPRPSAERS